MRFTRIAWQEPQWKVCNIPMSNIMDLKWFHMLFTPNFPLSTHEKNNFSLFGAILLYKLNDERNGISHSNDFSNLLNFLCRVVFMKHSPTRWSFRPTPGYQNGHKTRMKESRIVLRWSTSGTLAGSTKRKQGLPWEELSISSFFFFFFTCWIMGRLNGYLGLVICCWVILSVSKDFCYRHIIYIFGIKLTGPHCWVHFKLTEKKKIYQIISIKQISQKLFSRESEDGSNGSIIHAGVIRSSFPY